jgi:hypothetical protein
VALKAAQKQVAALQADPKRPPRGGCASTTTRAANNTGSCGSGSAGDSGTSADNSSTNSSSVDQQKLHELEGALRQASSDYALILRELGAMRADGASRQAGLQAALADKAAADAEVRR